jgi:hypothetical protein
MPEGRGPLQLAILRRLAEAPGGLASSDLADLANPDQPLQYRQSNVNGALGRLLGQGLVARTGTGVSNGSAGSGYRWSITQDGKQAAAKPTWAEVAEDTRERVAASRQRAQAALDAAREAGLGPGVPRTRKITASAALYAEGWTLQQIGNLFGVTRETVRLWLLETADGQ